ncbi:hypothetical protein ODIN_81 [Mycobacterium phage Odin]|nr:hypothetical protein ODIN_81 [Mycobacterium phage Odin]
MAEMDALKEALANFNETRDMRDRYIEENTDESGDWDCKTAEVVADYDIALAHLGEALADAVAKTLEDKEES